MEYITALAIGFLGSFHCIGMCGPIAVSLPVPNASNLLFFIGRILYNIGRVVSYSFLGLVFGLFGKRIILYGFQQGLSITLGVLILFIIFLPPKYKNMIVGNSLVQKFTLPLKNSISALFRRGTFSSLFLIGILNGFLPCGFVYIGLAGAMASGDAASGFLIMMLFGLGTIPAMFAMSLFGKIVNLNFRRKLSRITPVLAAILALIFILRGLNLGIPYLSPKLSDTVSKQEMMQCN